MRLLFLYLLYPSYIIVYALYVDMRLLFLYHLYPSYIIVFERKKNGQRLRQIIVATLLCLVTQYGYHIIGSQPSYV